MGIVNNERYGMEVLIYYPDVDTDKPIEIKAKGESLLAVKDRLDEVVTNALSESGHVSDPGDAHELSWYALEVTFTLDGEYEDSDSTNVGFCHATNRISHYAD